MNDRALRMERRLTLPVLAAALLSVPVILIEESEVTGVLAGAAAVLNWVVWLVFVAEAVLMLSVVDDRRMWLRTHPLEVAVVLLTAPLLPASMQAARWFRLLRLLRLIRLALLVRRLLSTEGVRDAAVLAGMTVLAGGTAYAAVERSQELSAWDGVWWAVVTVTTVGYGDSYPETDAGRVIAIVVMLVGIGFIAILTASAAERFMRLERRERAELDRIEAKLDAVAERLDARDRDR